MGSFVRLLLVASIAPLQLAAQVAGDSVDMPPLLEQRVAAAVAESWAVPDSVIELEWGRLGSNAARLTEDSEFRLLSGNGAAFVVDFRLADGSPLAIRLRAGMQGTVAVAARPLQSGAVLDIGDIVLTERTVWSEPNRSASGMPQPGWTVRRSVPEGTVLEPPIVQPPLLVSPGSRVVLVWERNRVSVSLEGSAINGGSMGDEVRVRLDNRRGRALGVVTGPGLARLVERGVR